MTHTVIFSAIIALIIFVSFFAGAMFGLSKNTVYRMIHRELVGELIVNPTDINEEFLSVKFTCTLGEIVDKDFVRLRIVRASSQEKPRV